MFTIVQSLFCFQNSGNKRNICVFAIVQSLFCFQNSGNKRNTCVFPLCNHWFASEIVETGDCGTLLWCFRHMPCGAGHQWVHRMMDIWTLPMVVRTATHIKHKLKQSSYPRATV